MLSSAFPLFHSPLLLAALLLYQCVIVQLLGLCPLTGNTHKPSQLMLTAAALALSIFLSITTTGVIQTVLLQPFQLGYFSVFVAVICVALSTQLTSLLLQHWWPIDSNSGKFAPVPMQISALAIVLLSNGQEARSIFDIIGTGIITGVIFAAIYALFAAQRERLLSIDTPPAFSGAAIHFITAGLVALALMGFEGII